LFPAGISDFISSPQRLAWLWGTLSLLSIPFRDFFPEDKVVGREADLSPTSSVEDKNGGAVLPFSHPSSLFNYAYGRYAFAYI
jgi:hypothetical protein